MIMKSSPNCNSLNIQVVFWGSWLKG